MLRHAREEFTLIFCRYLLAIALAMAVSGRASAAQPEQLPERTLLPGEVIRIEIEGEEELSRTVTIGSDGKVSLGFPGEVELAGLTRMEAAAAIRETLLRYLRDPVVAVTLVEHRFSVLGAVRRPGQFPMSGDQIPILDALAQAGGPEDRANLRKVRLSPDARGPPQGASGPPERNPGASEQRAAANAARRCAVCGPPEARFGNHPPDGGGGDCIDGVGVPISRSRLKAGVLRRP